MKTRHQAAALGVTVCAVLLLVLMVGSLMISVSADSSQDFGTNWSATYYNSTDLSGPVVYTEVLPSGININWGSGSPNAAVHNDNFSARFTSTQLFNAGTYEFVASSDDGDRVFIDGVLVLDKFIGRTLTTDRVDQTLTAGTHSLEVDYMELVDQAAVEFQWFQISTGGTPGLTPGVLGGGGVIITGTPGVTGCIATCATVTGVRGLALRSGPYLGASYITSLPNGQTYSVIGRNDDEGVFNWYELQDGTRTGWSSGRYLTLNVDLNVIPRIGSIFDQIDGASDIGARAYPRAVMNLRSRPSERMAKIASVPWGAPLELIGRTVQAGKDKWLQVRYNGVVGWVDARWVTEQGELFQVPIR